VPNNFAGQSAENREFSSRFKEFSGYNYPRPSTPFTYPTSVITASTAKPYNALIQDVKLQDYTPFKAGKFHTSPFEGIPVAASSDTDYRDTLTSLSSNGQNAETTVPQKPPYDPYTKLADRDNQARPFARVGAATDAKPLCDHSSPQTSAPPSPSEFVRGPRAAASVLAAAKELRDKCNHPFLGYVCKRSSDGHVLRNK
jgi:hypothetical protein